jgi:small GTP-binding protein
VKIFGTERWRWRGWPWKRGETATPEPASGDDHVALAAESLRSLLEDERVPPPVRKALADDYAELARMLEKLEQGHVHIAVFGEVSVGKSSLLNALVGEDLFSTSPLHGETRSSAMVAWEEQRSGGVYLVDTPGINEVEGEARETLARDVAARSDLLLFVVDGDLSAAERTALDGLLAMGRPLIVVLNKSDRYTDDELAGLLEHIRGSLEERVAPENILPASADPAPRVRVIREADGSEHEETEEREPDVEAVRRRLWEILDAEGKSLAAVNASLFAGQFSEELGRRVIEVRRQVAERLVRTYCIAKGIAVALNPVPVADLFAAAMVDASMVVHLSRLYGMPLNRAEAGSLIATIAKQMVALMGTVWAVHFVSSAIKFGTGGMSVMLTAGAQGAVAYYGTYIIGRAAERYFAQGKSWGPGGPKLVVEEILESVDRESILAQARDDLKSRLKASA